MSQRRNRRGKFAAAAKETPPDFLADPIALLEARRFDSSFYNLQKIWPVGGNRLKIVCRYHTTRKAIATLCLSHSRPWFQVGITPQWKIFEIDNIAMMRMSRRVVDFFTPNVWLDLLRVALVCCD